MEFLLLVAQRRAEGARAAVSADEAAHFGRQLVAQGVLVAELGPFASEEEAARVSLRNGAVILTNGPFDEPPEVVDGCYLIDVPDRAAAIEVAKRCPWTRAGVIEVRALQRDPWILGQAPGELFAFLYRSEPPADGPFEPRLKEMHGFTIDLKRRGVHVIGGRLPPETPPAFVEVRGSQTLVTDGPFAETKEVVAGFALMRVGSYAAALELASRVPHAQWGSVEVRPVVAVTIHSRT
jgi:hypothetical protein